MPRVSKEYFTEKRKEILHSAFLVCERKTVSSVTMQDIIDESGLSQGGIYRFYSNIDEILADLLSEIRTELFFEDKLDSVDWQSMSLLESGKKVWEIICNHIKEHYTHYKIQFEYFILLTNFPKRADVIVKNLKVSDPYECLNKRVYRVLDEAINSGRIKPVISLDSYFSYVAVFFDGMLKRLFADTGNVRKVLKDKNYDYDLDSMCDIAFKTSCYLLGLR